MSDVHIISSVLDSVVFATIQPLVSDYIYYLQLVLVTALFYSYFILLDNFI